MPPLQLDDKNLCAVCTHVWTSAYEATSDLTDLNLQFQEQHKFPQLELLESRAQAGCSFCAFLVSTLRDEANQWFDTSWQNVPTCTMRIDHLEVFLDAEPRATGDSVMQANGSCIAFLEFSWETSRTSGRSSTIYECRTSVLLNHSIAKFHALQALAAKNIDRIQNFTKNCVEHHDLCRSSQTGFVPTRVIDVRGDSDNIKFSRAPAGSRYTALSYCWGLPRKGFEDYKTLPSNFHGRFWRFSLKLQPPAIQDAVAVTRALGIHYLWVDVLCIIQGDKDDWFREGRQMEKVYENAFITIAAIATDSVWQSFLDRPSTCTSVGFAGTNGAVGEHVNTLTFRYPFCKDNSRFMLDAPWTQRAWCMQEQALSTRTLHFTKQFFYLECLYAHEMEIQTHGPPTRNLKPWHKHGESKERVDFNRIHRDWYSIVEQYTTRKITYDSDRIIAIAGLANRVSRVLPGDKYLKGLWLNDISRGILWTPDSQFQPKARSEGMPSWTWVSYPAAVLYDAIDINDDDEERPRSMCSAHVSSNEDKLILLGKCLQLRDLFPDESVVPEEYEVDTGRSEPNAWKLWIDIRGEVVKPSMAVAFAVRTTAFEVSGLLLDRFCDKDLPGEATYCRKGYFELSHEEGQSLFEEINEGQVSIV